MKSVNGSRVLGSFCTSPTELPVTRRPRTCNARRNKSEAIFSVRNLTSDTLATATEALGVCCYTFIIFFPSLFSRFKLSKQSILNRGTN